jgi:tetratricopeptide (TPR) repeat protein
VSDFNDVTNKKSRNKSERKKRTLKSKNNINKHTASTKRMTSPAEAIEDSDLSHLESFSKQGISLSYLINEFVENCGGSEALKGLSTTEVCNTFVKPATETCLSSYCDMLLDQQKQKSDHDNANNSKETVSRATVFISHAWKYEFLHVLDALEDHFKDEPGTIIWFDLFSNNQHKASDLPHEWWQTVFKSAIKDFGHTVMVMSPWNDPIPYTRAWCIFEAYCTVITESRFEIAMSAKEHDDFLKNTISDPEGTINTMLGKINAENSTSFLPEDKDHIFEVILKKVGFSKINSLVFEQLRQWVIGVAQKELEMNHDEKRRPRLLRMLGRLYQGQGKYQASQPLLEEALEKCKATLRNDHPDTLVSINDLAGLYQDQGNYNDAEPLYLECLEKYKATLGYDHPDTITSMNNLALLYQKQRKYNDAEPLYVECLEKRKTTLGDDYPGTLVSMNNLATLYQKQGNYNDAEPLFLKCLEKRKASLGADHPNTLSSMNNLALLYRTPGKYNNAEALYVECLEKYKVTLGDDHPSTLVSINNLASLYQDQGNYNDAEPLYVECLEKYKATLGDDHPNTLVSISNLASMYYDQGKYNDALPLIVECVEKCKASLGPDHPDNLDFIKSLSLVREKLIYFMFKNV